MVVNRLLLWYARSDETDCLLGHESSFSSVEYIHTHLKCVRGWMWCVCVCVFVCVCVCVYIYIYYIYIYIYIYNQLLQIFPRKTPNFFYFENPPLLKHLKTRKSCRRGAFLSPMVRRFLKITEHRRKELL